MPPPPLTAFILAAGKGTRMRSALPKVLHPFLGRPMLFAILDAALAAGATRLISIIGHDAPRVRAATAAAYPAAPLAFALQADQRGTGHAVAVALAAVPADDTLLILCGDTPLIRPDTLRALLAAHHASNSTFTISSFHTDNPAGYGRVIRHNSHPTRIVEHADATPAERAITEVNAGIYVANRALLAAVLPTLTPRNAQGELYLTDALAALAAQGHPVAAFTIPDPNEAAGVNTRAQLATLEALALTRLRAHWMDSGVTMLAPDTVRLDATVTLGEDTVLGPNVQLLGSTHVGRACRLDQGVILDSCILGDDVHVKPYTVATSARLDSGAEAGPFAHLRPGTHLHPAARVGNFVETKQATLHDGAKASHLSYLGDCDIGPRANIGAGTITCNYDGFAKHRTTIGADAFIGSDTQLVAPVQVGDRATVGAGTTVTRDVPADALLVTRAPPKVLDGYFQRYRLPRLNAKAGSPPPSAADAPDLPYPQK